MQTEGTDEQHEELHVPELDGVVSYPELLLWFSKPPFPQPAHLDPAVFFISISWTFFLLWACDGLVIFKAERGSQVMMEEIRVDTALLTHNGLLIPA